MNAPAGGSPPSLRRRLGIGLALGTALLWLGASLVAGLLLEREIGAVHDSALQEVAQRILPLAYAEVLSREEGAAAQRMPPVGAHREYITYVVRDAAGRELLQSSDADSLSIPKGLPPGFHTSDRLRTYTETAVQGTIVVTAAEELAHRREAVWHAVSALLWPLAALVPIAAAGVWLAVRLAFRPVVSFQAALAARGRGNLDPVGAEGLPREMAPVAASVNALIGRLRGTLEAERSFTANSAHELRTPIAAALAQAQRLVSELPDDARRERARAIAAALRRLSRLSEKLLQLAKAEGGGLIAQVPAPLAPVLDLVVDELRRQGEQGERIALAISDRAWASDLDPDAFAILARNLIENALRHGDPDEPVSVLLEPGLLAVANAGPVVPPERLEALTRPFERGPTEAQGSGLGLAIAAAICRGAGLTLDLSSPAPGRPDGFAASVRFTEARNLAVPPRS
ncbi:MAG: histidine kinase dimerization/phospho-acceptor domain-containing protein [Alsobacter sp.]